MAPGKDLEREGDPVERPKVKVTDRRRVRADSDRGEEARPDEPADVQEPSKASSGGEAAELREHLQRLQAEFENYRKRVLKEQTYAIDRAVEPLARRLLEVLDEFELALMAAEKQPDFEKFLHGVELVYAKLTDVLRAEGVERIEAEGAPFDPEKHEALMQSGEAGDADAGDPVVADVLRPGYTLKGRVIRPAGVKVTRSER